MSRQIDELELNQALERAKAMTSQANVMTKAEARRQEGNELYKAKSYEAAEAYYREAMEIITDFEAEKRKPFGGLPVDNLKPEAPDIDPDALAELNEAVVSCWNNIAMCNLKTESYETCLTSCHSALKLNANSVKAHFRKGQANHALKRYAAAREDLKQALALSPKDAGIVKELKAVRESERAAQEQDKHRMAKMLSSYGSGADGEWAYPRVFFYFYYPGLLDPDTKEEIVLDRVVIELFVDRAPKTCENFRALCTGEMGVGKQSGKPLHYKGTQLIDLQPGFCVRFGDIVNDDGSDGESIYGGYFEDENYKVKHSDAGIVTMVNKGPGTNNSQFGVLLCPAAWLNRKYVAFGRVIEGMHIMRSFESNAREDGKLITSPVIKDCGQLHPQ